MNESCAAFCLFERIMRMKKAMCKNRNLCTSPRISDFDMISLRRDLF